MSNCKDGIKNLFNHAFKFAKSGELKKVINIYEKILDIEPQFVEERELKDYVAKFLLYNREEIGCYKKVFEEEPKNTAERCINKALEQYLEREFVFTMSKIYENNGEFDKALQCLKKLIKNKPNDSVAWFQLGRVYYCKGKNNLALEALFKSIEINPDESITWNDLGVICAEFGKFRKAVKCYKRALLIYKNDEVVWRNLKYAYYELEDYERAELCRKREEELQKENKKPKTLKKEGNPINNVFDYFL